MIPELLMNLLNLQTNLSENELANELLMNRIIYQFQIVTSRKYNRPITNWTESDISNSNRYINDPETETNWILKTFDFDKFTKLRRAEETIGDDGAGKEEARGTVRG
ncbi:hypothetical protein Hanom_Chr15g01357531 [Helianthus anomalus]